MTTSEKVKRIVSEMSGLETVKAEDSLQEDIALDSFSMVSLLLEIEDAFNIELEVSDMNPFDLVAVQDVINLVEKYLDEKDDLNS